MGAQASTYVTPDAVNADLGVPAAEQTESLPWVPSPMADVERRMIERDGGEVARATSLVRYAPNSRFSRHTHGGGEEYLVLSGTFSDESGDYGPGFYVRNPPGSSHAPFTDGGCVIFVKLRQMPDGEDRTVHVDTATADFVSGDVPGHARLPLFDADYERVSIETLASGTKLPAGEESEEILVLSGTLRYGEEEYGEGTWLRRPAGRALPMASHAGCRIWIKRGHI